MKRLSPLVLRAVALVLEEIDVVVKEMCAAYLRKISFYRSMKDDPAFLDDVARASRDAAVLILTRFRDGTDLTPADREDLGALGRVRYEQGVPRTALMDAYRIGTDVVVAHVLERLRSMCSQRQYERLALQVSDELPRLSTQAVDAVSVVYIHAEDAKGGRGAFPSEDSLLRVLLDESAKPEAAARAAVRMGLRPEERHVVAVVGLVEAVAPEVHARALDHFREAAKRAVGMLSPHVVARSHGTEVVVIAEATALSKPTRRHRASEVRWDDEVAAALREAVERAIAEGYPPLAGGVGDFWVGVEGIRTGYRYAREVARLIPVIPSLLPVMTVREATPLLLLERDPVLATILLQWLVDPVSEHDRANGTELLRTLRVYAAMNRNVAETAERLHVVRETVRNRLERVGTITKVPVNDPWNWVLFSLALQANDLEVHGKLARP